MVDSRTPGRAPLWLPEPVPLLLEPAPCASFAGNPPIISSKLVIVLGRGPPCGASEVPIAMFMEFGHGGARVNSGGARVNSGGARPGAGRPKRPICSPYESSPRWYVARTKYGQTALADREIRQAGYTVFAPTIFKPATDARRDSNGTMRPGKPDRVDYLFVRYIIVSLDLSDPIWRDILHCDGVERILSSFNGASSIGIPIAVPDAAIAQIRKLLNRNDCVDSRVLIAATAKAIEPGIKVRILDGPMRDFEAICEMSDGDRIMLLMELLGRPQRIAMAQSFVEVV